MSRGFVNIVPFGVGQRDFAAVFVKRKALVERGADYRLHVGGVVEHPSDCDGFGRNSVFLRKPAEHKVEREVFFVRVFGGERA